ncbi:MAG: four helix bundle protein [Opitutaceae bacterium]|nr:four helix bundle protein [Opitutaceae bacterium]
MKIASYDLEERTAVFGEKVITFCQTLPADAVSRPLISQLIRSGTSIGANYCEADDAESKKDFRHKIGICRKEARETKYWFRMIAKALPSTRAVARPLWTEAKELHLIFAAIFRTTDRNLAASAEGRVE